jgi:hypothetical protein
VSKNHPCFLHVGEKVINMSGLLYNDITVNLWVSMAMGSNSEVPALSLLLWEQLYLNKTQVEKREC